MTELHTLRSNSFKGVSMVHKLSMNSTSCRFTSTYTARQWRLSHHGNPTFWIFALSLRTPLNHRRTPS